MYRHSRAPRARPREPAAERAQGIRFVLFACAVALAAAVALAEREREAGMPASHAQQDDGSLCLVAGDPPLVI